MEKLGKGLIAAAVFFLALLLTGCGKGKDSFQASCPYLWYEKHVEEGNQFSIVAITKNEFYGCYYKNHRLTAVFTNRKGAKTEKYACLPERFDVKDMGIDRKGNIFVLCGSMEEEKRTLWELDEKGRLRERGRRILLFEEEKKGKFIEAKGVKMEHGGGVYIW